MSRKISIDLNLVVPILLGIIVLLGVYIMVGNQKHVQFTDPVVTEKVIYQPDYYHERSEPIFLQQPTYFNPNLGNHDKITNNLYQIQMKEPFSFVSETLPVEKNTVSSISMPTMNNASHKVEMNLPSPIMPLPMESSPDSAGII